MYYYNVLLYYEEERFMLTNIQEKIRNWSNSKPFIAKMEKFFSGWQFIAVLTAFIFITQALGLELLGFTGIAFAFIFGAISREDISELGIRKKFRESRESGDYVSRNKNEYIKRKENQNDGRGKNIGSP
jgi:hypothetical protein